MITLLIFADGTGGLPQNWQHKKSGVDGYSYLTNESLVEAEGGKKYSNLTNESLIDQYGTITNRSLVSKYSNIINDIDAVGNTSELSNVMDFDLSNATGLDESLVYAIGGDINSKRKKKRYNYIGGEADVYSYLTNESLLNADGDLASKIGSFATSDLGKGLINSASNLINKGKGKGNPSPTGMPSGMPNGMPSGGKGGKPSETKIAGMSPVLFGIVALGAIAVLSIVVIKVMKHKSTSAKAPIAPSVV